MKTQKDFLREFIITHENNHHRPYGDVGHQIGTEVLFYSKRRDSFFIKFKKSYNDFLYIDIDENFAYLKSRMYNKETGRHDVETFPDKLTETDRELLHGIISPFHASFLNYKLQYTLEADKPEHKHKVRKI